MSLYAEQKTACLIIVKRERERERERVRRRKVPHSPVPIIPSNCGLRPAIKLSPVAMEEIFYSDHFLSKSVKYKIKKESRCRTDCVRMCVCSSPRQPGVWIFVFSDDTKYS